MALIQRVNQDKNETPSSIFDVTINNRRDQTIQWWPSDTERAYKPDNINGKNYLPGDFN
jgi:hypothetical protein